MKRGINEVRNECFKAFERGDTELGKKLMAEYRHMIANPKVRTVPTSPATKQRKRLFSRNGW